MIAQVEHCSKSSRFLPDSLRLLDQILSLFTTTWLIYRFTQHIEQWDESQHHLPHDLGVNAKTLKKTQETL